MQPLDPVFVEHALLNRLIADQERGQVGSEALYRDLFPGHDELVAKLYRDATFAPARATGDAGHAGNFGAYEPVEVLGRGGQGIVYLARDTRLPRMVALKVLAGAASLDQARQQRFRREAEVAARLDHPGLCSVLEFGVQDDVPYLAMQYVPGTSLAKVLAQDGQRGVATLPTSTGDTPSTTRLKDVLVLIDKVARALHAAHQDGVVHRDIKPGNIMITPNGEPVVLDFGLARDDDSAEHALTLSGDLMGTPAYMAPEQVESGSRPDRRTDVFALGVVLYECLTGARPFDAPTRQQMFDRILRGQFEPASARSPTVSRDLDLVLAVALDVDRDRRYETAGAFADDLQRVMRHEPVQARPAGWFVHLRRWARRNWILASCLVVIFVVFTTATLLTTSAWIQTDSARAKSEAINEFILKDLLAAANPRGLGREVRVVDALQRSVAQIDRRLGHNPPLAATVRMEIAKTYAALGAWQESLVLAERALATRQAVFGTRSEQALAAELLIGKTLADASRSDEARAALKSLLPRLDERHGADSVDSLTCRAMLCLAQADREPAAALPESLAVLARCTERFGPVAEVTRLARANRIRLLRNTNHTAASVLLAREQFELLATEFGAASFLAIESGLDYCETLQASGDRDGALQLLPDLVAQAESALGENHPDYLEALHALGRCYSGLEIRDEALTTLRLVADRATKALGSEHPWTLRYSNTLAVELRRQQKFDEALALTRNLLATTERVHGPDSAETASTLLALSSVLRGFKNWPEAIAASERALEIQERIVGKHDLTLSRFLAELGYAKKFSGDLAGATPILQRQVALTAVAFGDSHWHAQVQLQLGELLYIQGRYSEAYEQLQPALAFREQEQPPNVKRLHTTRALAAMTRYRLGETDGVLAEMESAWHALMVVGAAKFQLRSNGFFPLLRELYEHRGNRGKLKELQDWMRMRRVKTR